MPPNDSINYTQSRAVATTEGKQIYEKYPVLKVAESEADRKSENICKKNGALSSQNTNYVQHDRIQHICSVHQRKMQLENKPKPENGAFEKNAEKQILNENVVTSIKAAKTFCSCACCTSKNELIEKTLKDLQSQIQQLTSELNSYYTENQLLKKNIKMAKNVVKRDIGRNVESFEDILKKMTEDSWIGQQERIVSLKKELRHLKDELKEKGLDSPSSVQRRETISADQVSNDRKVHWRLKLERQNILRHTEREKQGLIDDRDKLKGKFELILNRNKILEEQVKATGQELNETKKASNGNFIPHLRKLEKKAKFCLDEKTRFRRSVEEEEMKEKELLNKVEDLKTKINSQRECIETTMEGLSKKRSDENKLQSLAATHESELISGIKDIDKSLIELEEKHKKNIEYLNILIDLNYMFEELFSQTRQKSSLSSRSDDERNSIRTFISAGIFNKSSEKVIGKINESIDKFQCITEKQMVQVKRKSVLEKADMYIQDTKEKSERTLAGDDQKYPTDESLRMKDEIERLVKLLEDKERENLEKSDQIYNFLISIKEKSEETLRNNSQLWRIASKIKKMLYKNKRLQTLSENHASALEREQHGFCHASWDELINKGEQVFNNLGKENKFLKLLIISVAESKAYDFDLYMLLSKRKKIIERKSTSNTSLTISQHYYS